MVVPVTGEMEGLYIFCTHTWPLSANRTMPRCAVKSGDKLAAAQLEYLETPELLLHVIEIIKK